MSGRPAAYAVARKNALHNRKRTLFLVLLVAVPVALAVVVAGVVRANSLTPDERAQLEMGTAQLQVWAWPNIPGVVDWVEQTAISVDPNSEFTEFGSASFLTDDFRYVFATDIDLTSPLTEGMYVLIEGRPPSAPGEAGLSPALADSLDLSVGDSIKIEDLRLGTLEVVGVIARPVVSEDGTVIVAPGALAQAEHGQTMLIGAANPEQLGAEIHALWEKSGRHLFWPQPAVDPIPPEVEFLQPELYVQLSADEVAELVELSRSLDESVDNRFEVIRNRAAEMAYGSEHGVGELAQIGIQHRSDLIRQGGIEDNSSLASTAVAAAVLVEVAFITGAAFAAGTRRRLREIGLLGANGASQKHIRTTVVGEGLTVGGIGAAAGVVLGLALLLVGRPIIERYSIRLVQGIGVGPLDILGPVGVALVSVVVAVLIPARTASKVPTTSALQGRMPASAPRKWVIPVGIGSATFGAVLISVSLVSRSQLGPVLVGLGAVLSIGGVAMLASPFLAATSRLANRVPATSRLVLRDSGRHRTRASVAVAAIMVILLIPVVVATQRANEDERDLVRGLPEPGNHLVVTGATDSDGRLRELTQADVQAADTLIGQSSPAVFSVTEYLATVVADDPPEPDHGMSFGPNVLLTAVASDSLLSVLGDGRLTETIKSGRIAVLGIADRNITLDIDGKEFEAREIPVPVQRSNMPRVLLPAKVADQLPIGPVSTRALFALNEPLTESQSRELYSSLELEAYGGWFGLSRAAFFMLAAAATLAIVMIVISLVTAVSAAEVDEELGTIVAVGAPGSFRKTFLGLMTGYQTLAAAALAIPLGVGLIKVYNSAQDPEPFTFFGPFGQIESTTMVIPWEALAVIGAGIPLTVALLTRLSVRAAPVTPPRRAT